jgi:hypothetical protein
MKITYVALAWITNDVRSWPAEIEVLSPESAEQDITETIAERNANMVPGGREICLESIIHVYAVKHA